MQLPIQIPARAFDLRFEDIVLLVLLPAWLVWLLRGRTLPGNLKDVGSAFAVYLAISLVGSAIAIIFGGLSLTRSLAYWAKEVEYLFILAISATWIWGALERRFFAVLLVGLGVSNAAWVGMQLLLGHTSALIHFPNVQGAFQRPNLLESYGPGLIGEVSPLSVGAFFMVVFLFAFSGFALAKTRKALFVWLALAAFFLTPNFLSQSRVTMAGCALGAGILVLYTRKFKRIAVGFLSLMAIGLLASYLTGGISTGRITVWKNIENSIVFRIQVIWSPLLAQKQGAAGTSATKGSTPAASTPAPSTATAPTPAASNQSGSHASASNPAGSNNAASNPAATNSATSNPAASSERDFKGRRIEIPLLGHGMGAMGAPGVIANTEAHDQYLRVFLESGALGLGAFLLLLGLTVRRLVLVIRSLEQPNQGQLMDKAIAIAALATLFAFIAGAIVQDMFLPVLPNELLWFVVGMALSIVAVRQAPAPTTQTQDDA